MKSIFITMVILDVMAVIGSIIGILSCYFGIGQFDPLPWCLFLAWGIIGIIKDSLIYQKTEMSTMQQDGLNQIDSTLSQKN